MCWLRSPITSITGTAPIWRKKIPHDPWGKEYQWHNPSRQSQSVYEVDISTTDNNGKAIVYGF